jgi:hypothetical protein
MLLTSPARQHRVEEIAQGVAAQPQNRLIQFGAKARQRAGRSGVHTRDYLQSGALSPSTPPLVQTQVRMTVESPPCEKST